MLENFSKQTFLPAIMYKTKYATKLWTKEVGRLKEHLAKRERRKAGFLP